MTVLLLIYEFFKTGLFALGGGLATIPFLAEMAEKHPWFTSEQLADMVAAAQSVPGPVGVSLATYAGFRAAGIVGGLVAALALVAPSVIVVATVSRFLDKHGKSETVSGFFAVLRPMSAGLIAGAVFPMLAASVISGGAGVNMTAVALYAAFVAVIALTDKFKVHPVLFIAAGATVGGLLF